jgi:transcriptional regulator with XRE-family HTH domain
MDQATLQLRLGDAVRQRRLALGHSQDAFADIIGMHRAYYSAIERGERNITLQTLIRVAQGLKMSIAKLMAAAEL